MPCYATQPWFDLYPDDDVVYDGKNEKGGTIYATGGTGGGVVNNFQTVDVNTLPASTETRYGNAGSGWGTGEEG